MKHNNIIIYHYLLIVYHIISGNDRDVKCKDVFEIWKNELNEQEFGKTLRSLVKRTDNTEKKDVQNVQSSSDEIDTNDKDNSDASDVPSDNDSAIKIG